MPESVFETFWAPLGIDKYEAQDTLDRFIALSLGRRDDKGRISLHDLQSDYVRKKTGESNLPALHERLLEAYRQACPDGRHTGPNDGYFLQAICRHLSRALHNAEMLALLTASSQWMDVKHRTLHSDESFAADLDYASGLLAVSQQGRCLIDLVQLYTAKQVVFQRACQWNEDLGVLVRLGRIGEAIGQA